jgi:hypothetical protein
MGSGIHIEYRLDHSICRRRGVRRGWVIVVQAASGPLARYDVAGWVVAAAILATVGLM